MSNKQPTFAPHPVTVHPDWHLDRCINAYQEHGSLIIGVDFDHTIRCPITGMFYITVVDLLKKAHKQGHTICIWTANEDQTTVQAHLESVGIQYHHFNASPILERPGIRKSHFNLLLEDTAGLSKAISTLTQFLVITKDN